MQTMSERNGGGEVTLFSSVHIPQRMEICYNHMHIFYH